MNEENNKKKIVPAYMKKENKGENLDKKQDKPKKKIKSKITILFIIVLLLILLLVGFGIFKLVEFFRFNSYSEYQTKMNNYAFSDLYNNSKATSSDYVTKSEALKVIIGAALNRNDIKDLVDYSDIIDEGDTDIEEGFPSSGDVTYEGVYTEDDENSSGEYVEKYTNAMWIDYSLNKGIISQKDIDQDNANEKVTYLEVIKYITNVKKTLLKKDLVSTTNLEFKDINAYTVEEQSDIADLVSTGVIENSSNNLNGAKKIHKGELNKLIINFVEKNNLITINGEKLNINKEKEPSNIKEYPYILANVDKSVYETTNFKADEKKYKNPLECFKDMKEQYLQISEIITTYFNTILNISYDNLSDEKIEEMKDNLKIMDNYYEGIDELDKYIEYVKANNIKITGSAKVQMPAVYFDGVNYRARTKIEYNIESSNDLKNVLYQDNTLKTAQTYKIGKEQKILDVPLSIRTNNNIMYVISLPISNIIAGGIVK